MLLYIAQEVEGPQQLLTYFQKYGCVQHYRECRERFTYVHMYMYVHMYIEGIMYVDATL